MINNSLSLGEDFAAVRKDYPGIGSAPQLGAQFASNVSCDISSNDPTLSNDGMEHTFV